MAHGRKRTNLFGPALSLRLTLILRVVVPLIAAMGAFSYLLLWTVERNTEQRLQEDVELVARAIRLPVSYSLERDRAGSVEQALESVFQIGRVYGAYVYDARGELVAAVGAVKPAAPTREVERLTEAGEAIGEYERIEGRSVYSYFVPLMETGGRINGLLQVTRRHSDFREDIKRLRQQALGLMLVLTLLVGGLILWGHRTAIGRHLQGLTESMARVERGERGHRAMPDGPREIAELGVALNGMLDAMAQAERELLAGRNAQAELERQLRQAEKMAAIGRLAAGVAHELGTPLSVIDGKAQRSLRDRELDGRHARNLREIRHEVERLTRIVRQLLDFGRRPVERRRRVLAGDLASAAARAVADEFQRQRARLELLPPAEEPALEVDPVRLEQALVNLLRNAAQASPGGRVRLGWRRQAEALIFEVDDDGAGVAEAHRPSLFEPFFTTKPVGEGTGLGLAVVHGVASEHGGTVELDRGELGGALFRLRLPQHGRQTEEQVHAAD